MKLCHLHLFPLLVVVAFGCGGEETGLEKLPVTGTVRLDDAPLPGADVTFIPTGTTPGMGGTARTDSTGRFTLNYARGGEGAPAGEYRVIVSHRLMPDGTPVLESDETPPIESPAREMLPPVYSSPEQTQLTATIQPGEEPVDLELKSPAGGG